MRSRNVFPIAIVLFLLSACQSSAQPAATGSPAPVQTQETGSQLTPVILTPTNMQMPTPGQAPASAVLPNEITDLKGVPMRLVPAGEFTMGRAANEAMAECQKYSNRYCTLYWFTDEEPAHQVYLDAYYMDKYEVTNALYKACADAGVCHPPQNTGSQKRISYYGNSKFDNYPVINVDWNQANTYCEWRGGSLPTEAQWEKAARGTDGRTYPWGEGIDCKKANYLRKGGGCVGDTAEVGSYPGGVSPYGIYDLAGNVWEWVADLYSETYYESSPSSNPTGPAAGSYHVLRGGSWYDLTVDNLRVSNRRGADDVNNRGFRCARNVTP